MKAIRVDEFGGPDVLKLKEMPDPHPGNGQVVIAIHSIGVNPVDTYIRSGKYGPKAFPYTPGTDAAGVVEMAGPQVTAFKTGQRVYVYGSVGGSYASKMVCTSDQVHPLPDRLSFDQGAGIGVPFGTAYRALFVRGLAKANEVVLIHGASGGVGTAAVQLAVNYGCRVIGTAGTPQGMETVKKLGADAVFDHRSNNYLEQIASYTGKAGVDLIIEMVSDQNLGHDLNLLGKRGRVVVVGNRGPVQIEPRQMMTKDSDIRGMSLTNADTAELAMIHAALGAGFFNGSLTPVVSSHYALAQAGQAHEAVLKGGLVGKIVLRT